MAGDEPHDSDAEFSKVGASIDLTLLAQKSGVDTAFVLACLVDCIQGLRQITESQHRRIEALERMLQ